jgi:subtilisin family serine protease
MDRGGPLSPTSSIRPRLAALALAAAAAALLATAQAGPAVADNGKIRHTDAANVIAGSYIVVFKDSVVPKNTVRKVIDRLAARHKAAVRFSYTDALRGFSARMSKADAQRLATDPSVNYVEQDRTVSVAVTQSPTPSWGLDRIDQRNFPLDNSYTYPAAGAVVRAYIIDTGIRTTHSDFGGRATWGTNTIGGVNADCSGHGTHVAGTVGGSAYGVAKAVRLVAVKVLDCTGSGPLSGIAAGVDWVTADHTSGPAVANMSIGAPGSDSALETAIRNSIADGVTYAIASGNSSADACNFTPARVSEAITVNASTRTDARASFSNFGSCTDVFAPGQDITSDSNTSDTATKIMSGTSMATPHVTGAAALILSASPAATPAQVWSTMLANSTPGKVTSPGTGSPNRLVFVDVCKPVSNGTKVLITDFSTVQSKVTITGCVGTASAKTTVEVHIVHTHVADLVIDLIAPDGTAVNLWNREGGSAINMDKTFSINLAPVGANGTWALQVRDAALLNVGLINSWTLDP